MAEFEKKFGVIDAYYPRMNEWATASGDDHLKLAYNVYTNKSAPKGPKPVNLVFSHGNGMHKDIWDFMIRQLWESDMGPYFGRIIAIDSVNQCDSYQLNKDKIGWVSLWPDNGRDINKLVRELGIESEFNILIGHSMGGTTTMYAAYFEPQFYDSIVVIDPIVWAAEGYRTVPVVSRFAAERFRLVKQKLQDKFETKEEYLKYMNTRGIGRKFHPEVKKAFFAGGMLENPDGTVSYKTPDSQQLATYYGTPYAYEDSLKMAQALDCEVLHIAGTVFNLVPADSVPECRSILRHCTPVDIEGGNHLVPFEHANETFAAILPFVTRRFQRASERLAEREKIKSLNPRDLQEYVKDQRAKFREGFLTQWYSKL